MNNLENRCLLFAINVRQMLKQISKTISNIEASELNKIMSSIILKLENKM